MTSRAGLIGATAATAGAVLVGVAASRHRARAAASPWTLLGRLGDPSAVRTVVLVLTPGRAAPEALAQLRRSLKETPAAGVRVLVVAGERLDGRAARTFLALRAHDLDPAHTELLCLSLSQTDVGAGAPALPAGEGRRGRVPYPAPMREALAHAARLAGVRVEEVSGTTTISVAHGLRRAGGHPAVALLGGTESEAAIRVAAAFLGQRAQAARPLR